jgi:hypothetical protein
MEAILSPSPMYCGIRLSAIVPVGTSSTTFHHIGPQTVLNQWVGKAHKLLSAHFTFLLNTGNPQKHVKLLSTTTPHVTLKYP